MPIAALVAILVAGGVSLSAENVTPRNILYPVKVNINEEVRAALAFSQEAKASWNARRAERRLEEAERLSIKAKLDAEARAKIEENLNEHIASFEENVRTLRAEGSATAVVEASSEFEAKLKAHAQTLTALSAELPDARMHLEPILSRVLAGLSASSQSRVSAEADVRAGGPSVKSAAEGKARAAENKITEVRKFVSRMKADAETSIAANAETRLSSADAAFARGKAQLEAASYGEAFVSFEEASRIAQEAKIMVVTGDRIELGANDGVGLRVRAGEPSESSDTTGEQGASVQSTTNAEVRGGNANASSSGSLRVDLGL